MRAMLFGFIVACISYVCFRYIPFLKEDDYTLNKAVLLGLLVAELGVFSVSDKIPSIVLILFFLFMYFFGMAEVV